jgi:excisionase family DNA binding protein
MTGEDEILKYAGAAELTKFAPQTLRAFVSRRRHGIPFIKIGRSVRFKRSQLEKWMADRSVNVAPATPTRARRRARPVSAR